MGCSEVVCVFILAVVCAAHAHKPDGYDVAPTKIIRTTRITYQLPARGKYRLDKPPPRRPYRVRVQPRPPKPPKPAAGEISLIAPEEPFVSKKPVSQQHYAAVADAVSTEGPKTEYPKDSIVIPKEVISLEDWEKLKELLFSSSQNNNNNNNNNNNKADPFIISSSSSSPWEAHSTTTTTTTTTEKTYASELDKRRPVTFDVSDGALATEPPKKNEAPGYFLYFTETSSAGPSTLSDGDGVGTSYENAEESSNMDDSTAESGEKGHGKHHLDFKPVFEDPEDNSQKPPKKYGWPKKPTSRPPAEGDTYKPLSHVRDHPWKGLQGPRGPAKVVTQKPLKPFHRHHHHHHGDGYKPTSFGSDSKITASYAALTATQEPYKKPKPKQKVPKWGADDYQPPTYVLTDSYEDCDGEDDSSSQNSAQSYDFKPLHEKVHLHSSSSSSSATGGFNNFNTFGGKPSPRFNSRGKGPIGGPFRAAGY